MTKDEALDLALEALENWREFDPENFGEVDNKAITAIKQARSAPVQEPVAVVKVLPLGDGHKPMHWADWTNADNPPPEGTLLHTGAPVQEPVGLIESLKDAQPCCGQYEICHRACTPRGKFLGNRDAQRQWVGLTDEDKLMCWARATHDADVEHKTEHQCLMDYGTEIEAKLKEKNT